MPRTSPSARSSLNGARVGKTQIVNLDRLNSAPLTLKFDNLPEDQALDIICGRSLDILRRRGRCRWPTRQSTIALR
jgi:hypothetical protein